MMVRAVFPTCLFSETGQLKQFIPLRQVYIIIAVSIWFYPSEASTAFTC